MPTGYAVYTELAERYGLLKSPSASQVNRFFTKTLRTFTPELQQRIAFEISVREVPAADGTHLSPSAIDELFIITLIAEERRILGNMSDADEIALRAALIDRLQPSATSGRSYAARHAPSARAEAGD